MTDGWALTLEYRDDKIVEVYAGPHLHLSYKNNCSRRSLETYSPRLEEKFGAGPHYLHPAASTAGGVTVTNFRFFPAPASAPQARELFADHPFILDVAFDDSPNFLIRQSRYSRKAIELCLLLSVALRTGTTWPSSRSRKHWVWAPEGFEQACIWAGEGYIIPGFIHLVDDLPRLDEIPPLPEIRPILRHVGTPLGYADHSDRTAENCCCFENLQGQSGIFRKVQRTSS